MIIRFWETFHLLLPYTNINTYFSLTAKCWFNGGVWQFPRNVYMTREFSWKRFSIQMWYIFRLNKAC